MNEKQFDPDEVFRCPACATPGWKVALVYFATGWIECTCPRCGHVWLQRPIDRMKRLATARERRRAKKEAEEEAR